jgi:hypothetical protein
VLRDVFNYTVQQTLVNMPAPGLSAVTPSAGATGAVSLAGVALGTFYGLLQILTTGPLGTATAQLSLNAAAGPGIVPTFQSAFTLPAGGTYEVPLEQYGKDVNGNPFNLPSGFQLGLTGSFTEGDSYSFYVSATPDFRVGEEHLSEQDRIFPSVVFVPLTENFEGTEDYAGTKTYLNSPRAVAMGENIIEAHCWGIDIDRTELLKNQVIYGVKTGVPSPSRILSGRWTLDGNAQNKAGREYVFQFTAKIPVVELDARSTTVIQPPHLLNLTSQVVTT